MSRARLVHLVVFVGALSALTACGGKKTPTAPPSSTPAPSPFPGTGARPAAPAPATPEPVRNEPVPVPPPVAAPIAVDPLSTMSLDEVNRGSALKPVFFLLDSDQLDDTARQTLTEDSQVMRKYPSWVVTIEGHCDERGTAEYNLALGDRRAQAARAYLVSLGVPAERLRTVSYGNEFPFDPGHDEAAWAKNRRAQFMVTAK